MYLQFVTVALCTFVMTNNVIGAHLAPRKSCKEELTTQLSKINTPYSQSNEKKYEHTDRRYL